MNVFVCFYLTVSESDVIKLFNHYKKKKQYRHVFQFSFEQLWKGPMCVGLKTKQYNTKQQQQQQQQNLAIIVGEWRVSKLTIIGS